MSERIDTTTPAALSTLAPDTHVGVTDSERVIDLLGTVCAASDEHRREVVAGLTALGLCVVPVGLAPRLARLRLTLEVIGEWEKSYGEEWLERTLEESVNNIQGAAAVLGLDAGAVREYFGFSDDETSDAVSPTP